MLEFRETDEHCAMREAVSAIGAKFGHTYFQECTNHERFPEELWETIHANGFGGVNLPAEFGGGGGGIQELAIVVEELAAHGCPLTFSIIGGMGGPIIDDFGTWEQKERWLPSVANGSLRICFATTEADAGSNIYRTATNARRDGDNWILDGEKCFITAIDCAQEVLVVARTGTDARDRAILSLFLVDTTSPGLEYRRIPMEIREPEQQFLVNFSNVVVPHDRLIGGVEGKGFEQIFSGLNPERINVSALAIGLGRYFLRKAVDYANVRQVWDRPIGAYQSLAHPLAEAKIQLELAKLMMTKAAWQFDNKLDGVGESSAMAKFTAADAAQAAFNHAIQVHGGNAFTSEYGIADLWGLTRLTRSAPVSREMVLNFVTQHSLGLPRSY